MWKSYVQEFEYRPTVLTKARPCRHLFQERKKNTYDRLQPPVVGRCTFVGTLPTLSTICNVKIMELYKTAAVNPSIKTHNWTSWKWTNIYWVTELQLSRPSRWSCHVIHNQRVRLKPVMCMFHGRSRFWSVCFTKRQFYIKCGLPKYR